MPCWQEVAATGMVRHATAKNSREGPRPTGETDMKALVAFAFIVASLALGVALSACADQEVGSSYYENDVHGGYPGPGTRTPGREG